jgi:hypothetical protein
MSAYPPKLTVKADVPVRQLSADFVAKVVDAFREQ